MDKQLSELIRVSNIVGCDRALVQGGGGNTSVKTDDGKYMYIKASGTALKDMSVRRGWRRLNLASVLEIFTDSALPAMDIASRESQMVRWLLRACKDDIDDNVRPSVESPMHAFLDKCVIHLHAIAAQSYTSAKNGKAEISSLFSEEQLPPLWVPYANPGFELGHKVSRLVAGYLRRHGRKPAVLFIQKHGLLVSSPSADGALELVHRVIRRCEEGLDQPETSAILAATKEQIEKCKQNIAQALLKITGEKTNIGFCNNSTVKQFLAGKQPWRMLNCGPLTPDEMAFVDGPILWLKNGKYKTVAEKIRMTLGKGQPLPKSFLVKDIGLFVAAEASLLGVIEDIVVGSLFIRRNARRMGGINALNSRQRDFIQKWEAEQFRVKLAAKSS